jgi:regulator of Ty1 transposition protein 103
MDHVPQVRLIPQQAGNLAAPLAFIYASGLTIALDPSRRHADRIAGYWLTRLRDSPPARRLNYIYLVNDIVQNARARKRSEFPDAFSPLMAEAVQTAYRSSPPEIQQKIRRVVEVWRTRSVFEVPIQEAIEARIDDVDRSKGAAGKKTLMGKSLAGGSSTGGGATGNAGMPKELETLAPLQVAVTKNAISARPAVDAAQTEYAKVNDPAAPSPSPPVHAARLSGLMKSLAAAESSVSAGIRARKALVADLERILEINRSALAEDEQTLAEIDTRKAATETKKREVEDGIIRGLSSSEQHQQTASATDALGAGTTAQAGSNGSRPSTCAILPPALDNNATTDNGGDEGNHNPTGAFSFSERPEIEALTPEREVAGDDYDFGLSQSPPPQQQQSTGADRPDNPAVAAALAGFSGGAGGATGGGGGEYTPFTSNFVGGDGGPYYGGPVAASIIGRVRSSSGHDNGAAATANNGFGAAAKRRKMSSSHGERQQDFVPDLGEMGMEGEFGLPPGMAPTATTTGGQDQHEEQDLLRNLNDDVEELLRQEGGGFTY